MTKQFQMVDGPGVWTGDSLGGKQALCFDLETAHLRALADALAHVRKKGLETEQIKTAHVNLTPIVNDLRKLNEDLKRGRGLLVVRGFPVEQYSPSDLETLFWCFGIQFGEPVSQSVLGDRLGHVIDVTDTDPHARAYRNNRELTLHTDLGDAVSFLCVRKAESGGVSWFSSALAVHNEILSTRPDLLALLYRGYRWFRSGENADGSQPLTPWRVPVLSEREGWVSCRYVRDYILEGGVHETGEALTADELEALDYFDEISHRSGVPIKFTLEPGEAVFINNLTVLHARTKFVSHTNAHKKRLLLRLWMKSADCRPSVSELQIFDGADEQGIPPQAGRTPSYRGQTEAQLMPTSAHERN
jgi:hypothetical protein